MSRLEPAGEPSMEEILASIRKIIAEDPPGSRSVPEPQQAAKRDTSSNRSFLGLETLKASPVVSDHLLRKEPVLTIDPVRLETPKMTPAPFDIDAQMEEVLGKVRAAQAALIADAPAPALEEPKLPRADLAAPKVQAALDSLLPEPLSPAASTQPLSRPGFSVARDGYIPEAPAAQQKEAVAREVDPFEFSLGPSPFALRDRRVAEVAVETPKIETPVAAEAPTAEAPTAEAPVAALQEAPTPTPAPEVVAAEPPAQAAIEPAQATIEPVVAKEIVADDPVKSAEAGIAEPVLSDLVPVAQTVAQVVAPEPQEEPELEVASEEPAPVLESAPTPAQAISTIASLPSRAIEPSFVHPAPGHANAAQRSMEDTVAELLRPMLRNWLSENMPRIVETALRKELDESLQSEHKTAAE